MTSGHFIGNREYFPGIGAIPYEGPESDNPLAFKAYDAGRKVGGKTSLYLGDPKTFVYANDKHVKASVTTPSMAVPKHDGVKPTMEFWLFLATEESKGYDFLAVTLSVDGSKDAPVEVWNSDSIGGSTHQVWALQKVDLSKYAGQKVSFTFTFDTKDGYVNAFEGASALPAAKTEAPL